MPKCRIRQDLIDDDLGVPFVDQEGCVPEGEHEYKYTDDDSRFWIMLPSGWVETYNIDFEFID
ncbi:MAG: hypothetical protein GY774_16630 [Planctomycetes bacterium]|nr:hypothetical protein [Planctomycetota bacterium]